MEKFTVEEFQDDFDNLLERVESGENFIITDQGKEVAIMSAKDYECIVDEIEGNDDLIRIHTEENNEAQ
jgi:prevent-host-death family protein